MAIQPIALLGNPVLRRRCVPVSDPASADVRRVVTDLFDTLNDFRQRMGFGRGIAAPQISAPIRVIAINVDSPITLINPRIKERSISTFPVWDDCFSFPELRVKVRRHRSIVVRYTDGSGKRRELRALDGLSELLQHEIDHLDGILAIDRAMDKHSIMLASEYQQRIAK